MSTLTRTLRCIRRPTTRILTTTITTPITPTRTVRIAASATAQDHHASTNTTPPTIENVPPTFHKPTPQATVEHHIAHLPLIQSLRRDPHYRESRPHLSMNPSLRPSHFVAGSLNGSEKITVPPYMFTATEKLDTGARAGRVISVFHIGKQLCGHPGFVHGGLLSVMFDEAFARCVSASFASGLGMTANLNVDFRKPAVPDRVYVLRAETVKVEGRKAWVEGSLSSLPGTGEEGEPVMVAEGRALFVEPKFAEMSSLSLVGGVIGLYTAYNLACENEKAITPVNQKMIVLETRPSVFAAASSHNTGCLQYYFPESFGEDLTPLGKYSFELWQSIAQNDWRFVRNIGYRSDSFLPPIPGSGRDEEALSQTGVRQKRSSRGDSCTAGIMETPEVWGSAAVLSKENVVEGVECSSVNTRETYVLPCQKLVLAAGPWTPALVKALFPASTLDLQPSPNAGDWVELEHKNVTNLHTRDSKSIAVVLFDEIIHEKLEFAGRNNARIWGCGRRTYTAELPPPNDAGEENLGPPPFLLKGDPFDRRPSPTLLPFISEIPSHLLLSSEMHSTTSSGDFVCYGHGSYGITLGMGSGKLMAQLVRNEKTDVDISKSKVASD
ncbi:Thioesterase super member 4 [Aspergillus hancockii]|nr:Thioesterase super member 4 [Aspergillus hancockii]